MSCFRCGAAPATHATVTQPVEYACDACYNNLMHHVLPPASRPGACDGCGAPFGAGCNCDENRRAIQRGETRKAREEEPWRRR